MHRDAVINSVTRTNCRNTAAVPEVEDNGVVATHRSRFKNTPTHYIYVVQNHTCTQAEVNVSVTYRKQPKWNLYRGRYSPTTHRD